MVTAIKDSCIGLLLVKAFNNNESAQFAREVFSYVEAS
jgi:hypothetical protein